MKHLFAVLGLFFVFSFQGSNPSIKVYEKEEKVEKLQRKGYAVLILLEQSIVKKAWNKKVKEFGKLESRGDEYVVQEAVMPTISAQPTRLYSKVMEKTKQGTEVWMSVDLGTEFVSGKHAKSEEIETILYQFAVDVYRADYALQVEEAEKALAKTNREYERSVATELRITNKMQRNREQKKDLLEKLKENKMDSIQLVKDKEVNRLEQKQDSLEVVKMKKAVEIVKAKMATIK